MNTHRKARYEVARSETASFLLFGDMVVDVLVNDNKRTKSLTVPLAASSDAMGYRKRNQIVFITNDSLIGQWPDFVVCCLWQRNRQQNDCPMNGTRVTLCGVLFGGYLCRRRKEKYGRARTVDEMEFGMV